MNEKAKLDGRAKPSQTAGAKLESVLWAPEPFVDAEQAGQFLCIRPRRAVELARKGILPAHPLGNGSRKVWRFRLSELASAVCERRVDCVRQSPAPRQETI